MTLFPISSLKSLAEPSGSSVFFALILKTISTFYLYIYFILVALDQLIERLLIVDKIQQGVKDVEEGNSLSEEEMDKVMEKWFV